MYRIKVVCQTCSGNVCEFIEKKIDGFRKSFLNLDEINKPTAVMSFLKKNGYYICTRCGKKSWE